MSVRSRVWRICDCLTVEETLLSSHLRCRQSAHLQDVAVAEQSLGTVMLSLMLVQLD